jgi:hypothetical protein
MGCAKLNDEFCLFALDNEIGQHCRENSRDSWTAAQKPDPQLVNPVDQSRVGITDLDIRSMRQPTNIRAVMDTEAPFTVQNPGEIGELSVGPRVRHRASGATQPDQARRREP